MFPTFCTETPTWRWRNVGWIERRTKVASYRAPGTSRNDDEPIHVFVPFSPPAQGPGPEADTGPNGQSVRRRSRSGVSKTGPPRPAFVAPYLNAQVRTRNP